MHFFATFVLLVGISLTSARPADVNIKQQANPQKEFQRELMKAMEPVQAEVRSMAQNAQAAAQDLTKAVEETGVNLLKAGQDFLKPVESRDRANIGSVLARRIQNLGKAVQQNARDLLQRAMTDVKPLQVNEKSAFFGVKDAVQMLEDKYLTRDGQDVVKLAMKVLTY